MTSEVTRTITICYYCRNHYRVLNVYGRKRAIFGDKMPTAFVCTNRVCVQLAENDEYKFLRKR